jgi:DNA-binding transcriptional MerR regulator
MAADAYLTIGAVAKQVGVIRWRLAYLIERGDVPGPSLVVPGRRLFTEEDVRKIRKALAERRISKGMA